MRVSALFSVMVFVFCLNSAVFAGSLDSPAGGGGVPETGQTVQYDTNALQADDGGALSSPRFTNSDTGTVTDILTGLFWLKNANRFTNSGNGTVRDNLTGLIWLKNADCANAARNWQTALNDVVSLNTNGTMNSNDCEDTSNSGVHQTDWRLPTRNELNSLVHCGYFSPALPNTAGAGKWTAGDPFTGVW
ncbi:MAG: DUF1566 domain-containing protein [Desulfobacteraceae bacterium]|nr:DUF1566 domain-containing protein [Desulfobacteraceae bacterium]